MSAPLSKLLIKLPSVLSHDTVASFALDLTQQCEQFFSFDASTPTQGAFTRSWARLNHVAGVPRS